MIATAAVLAGGRGSRLCDTHPERPKPMMEVGGRPFLEWLLIRLRQHGVSHVILCTGYGADAIESHFGSGSGVQVRVTYSREPAPLGTGGALRVALDGVDGPVLVLNGDSFCAVDYQSLGRRHVAARARVTMACAWTCDISGTHGVRISSRGLVTDISHLNHHGAGLINAGVYVMTKDVLGHLRPGVAASLEGSVLPPLVREGHVAALQVAGSVLDIGTSVRLARARAMFAESPYVTDP